MDLMEFKRQELPSFLVGIYVIKTEVKVEYNESIKTKNLYTFIGTTLQGRRLYLTYGINYKEDTEFWLQKFKDLKRRGVNEVLYITTPDIKQAKRAAEITYFNVKILESQFELIDKINKYTGTGYTNHIPRDISKLYIYETKERYQEELCIFNENYKEYKIIKILLEEKLKEIENYYKFSYNVRRVLFPYYHARDYKALVKKELRKRKIIRTEKECYEILSSVLETQESHMIFPKKEWLKIMEELSEIEKVRENL